MLLPYLDKISYLDEQISWRAAEAEKEYKAMTLSQASKSSPHPNAAAAYDDEGGDVGGDAPISSRSRPEIDSARRSEVGDDEQDEMFFHRSVPSDFASARADGRAEDVGGGSELHPSTPQPTGTNKRKAEREREREREAGKTTRAQTGKARPRIGARYWCWCWCWFALLVLVLVLVLSVANRLAIAWGGRRRDGRHPPRISLSFHP